MGALFYCLVQKLTLSVMGIVSTELESQKVVEDSCSRIRRHSEKGAIKTEFVGRSEQVDPFLFTR